MEDGSIVMCRAKLQRYWKIIREIFNLEIEIFEREENEE